MSVKESDRDFSRLWVKDIRSDKIEIIVRRFARAAFGNTASQFLLAVSIHKHLLMKMLIKILSRNSQQICM